MLEKLKEFLVNMEEQSVLYDYSASTVLDRLDDFITEIEAEEKERKETI